MAENTYRNGDAPTVVQFEELADLHDVVMFIEASTPPSKFPAIVGLG